MADEQIPAPFNSDALASQIRAEVRGAFGEFAQAQQTQQTQQAAAQQNARAQQQAAGDPIHNAIYKPYVEPALRQMAIQTQGAVDAVKFYNKVSDAKDYTDQIETRFNQMAAQGIPFDRQTIWDHFKGQNEQHFAERRQQQLQNASARGASIGGAAIGRPDARFDEDAWRAMPLDQKRAVVMDMKI